MTAPSSVPVRTPAAGRVRTLADVAGWSARRAPHVTFAGPDPHYGIGLEGHLKGYGIACLDATPAVGLLERDGIPVLAVGDGDADGHSTTGLLESPRALDWLRARAARGSSPLPLLVFKTSHRLESLCDREGWRLLCAPAALGRRWENKIAFRQRADALGLRQPPGGVVERQDMDYDALAAAYGPRLVVQAPYGYAGMQSHLVDGRAATDAALAGARSPSWRVTRYVEGLPLSVNACVTARGVAVGAPFLQLTGLPEATPFPLGSCGQDWAITSRLDADWAGVRRMADVIGGALARDGYRGVFGVDAVQGADGELYAIEVNPRLIASIALFTQLEIAAGRLPLLARHVIAHLDPDADEAPLDLHHEPLPGAQIVLHNVGPAPFVVRADVESGAWPLPADDRSPAERAAAASWPAYRVDRVPDGAALALMPAPGRTVAPGAAHARVQLRGRGAATLSGGLTAEAAAVVDGVRDAVGAPRG